MADVPLFNPNDGLTGRDGGPYLDILEAEEAEKRRAKVEGRKPDTDNPPATAGIQLVTAAQLIHQAGNTMSVVSQNQNQNSADNAEKMVMAIADDDDNNFKVVGHIPMDNVERLNKEAADRELKGSDFNPNDPNAPVDVAETATDDDKDTKSTTKSTSASRASSSTK